MLCTTNRRQKRFALLPKRVDRVVIRQKRSSDGSMSTAVGVLFNLLMVIEAEGATTTIEIEPTTLSQPITDNIHYDNIGGCFIDSITLDGCLEGAKLKIDSANFHHQPRGAFLRQPTDKVGTSTEGGIEREKRFAEQTNQLGQVIEANLSIKFIIHRYLQFTGDTQKRKRGGASSKELRAFTASHRQIIPLVNK